MNDIDAALAGDRTGDRRGCGFRASRSSPITTAGRSTRRKSCRCTRGWRAYNLPILLHPRRTNTSADYEGEATSKYLVYTNFGWPYETSLAMARLAFGGPWNGSPR